MSRGMEVTVESFDSLCVEVAIYRAFSWIQSERQVCTCAVSSSSPFWGNNLFSSLLDQQVCTCPFAPCSFLHLSSLFWGVIFSSLFGGHSPFSSDPLVLCFHRESTCFLLG